MLRLGCRSARSLVEDQPRSRVCDPRPLGQRHTHRKASIKTAGSPPSNANTESPHEFTQVTPLVRTHLHSRGGPQLRTRRADDAKGTCLVGPGVQVRQMSAAILYLDTSQPAVSRLRRSDARAAIGAALARHQAGNNPRVIAIAWGAERRLHQLATYRHKLGPTGGPAQPHSRRLPPRSGLVLR